MEEENNSNELSQSSQNNIFLNEGVRKGIKYSFNVRDIVKILCRERGLKLTDLATKIGITKQSLNHYISGRWAVPTQIKVKIARALNVDSSVIWDLK
jgi:lambda repressor-like predicted transcriptional regulator